MDRHEEARQKGEKAYRLELGHIDAAIRALKKALALRTLKMSKESDLSDAYRAGAQRQEADWRHVLGCAFAAKGSLDEAATQFRIALELDPQLEKARTHLAEVLSEARAMKYRWGRRKLG